MRSDRVNVMNAPRVASFGGVVSSAENPAAHGGLATVQTSGLASVLLNGQAAGLTVGKPFSQAICLAEGIRVAGTTHVPAIDEIVSELSLGDRLSFARECENAFDTWAIKVFDAKKRRVGFVPRTNNEMLARLMDGGKLIYGTVKSIERCDSWNKIEMKVYLDD